MVQTERVEAVQAVVEGVLERKCGLGGLVWKEYNFFLDGKNTLYQCEKDTDVRKEKLEVEQLDVVQKDGEHCFNVHGTVGEKHEKWHLRAKSAQDVEAWRDAVAKNKTDAGKTGAYNYGLPPEDPRTLLPLISVPPEYANSFGYLNMAVVHWFGKVKKLGSGYSVEERIAVLGDRCLYLCKKNADITRCVLVSDIKKLLLAQDDAKDLYVAIIMPETIETRGTENQTRCEYDLMFHSSDIQTFVKYLRTVYVYQTSGKNLSLEQVRDKDQLEKEIRLARPKNWALTYWPPMFKEHLARLLQAWQQQQQQQQQPQGQQQQQQQQQAKQLESKPAAGGGGADDLKSVEESPLGKFLVLIGLSKYFKVMRENNMELELMVSGLIDDSDLEHFGVEDPRDRAAIVDALQDQALVERLTKGSVSSGGLGYQPPKQLQKEIREEREAMQQPKLAADDDLDLDLDLDLGLGGGGGAAGGAASPKTQMGGGGDFLDLDLDDFGAMDVPASGAADLNLDDLDLDLDMPVTASGPAAGAAGGGGDLDLDLDLDLGGPAPAAAAPAAGGADLDLDLDL